MKIFKTLFLVVINAVLITSCNKIDDISGNPGGEDIEGAIYVMTNDPGGNEVVAYKRNENGSLTKIGVYDTGGNGRDVGQLGFDPLESQDAIIVDNDKELLFVVNAGSNSISSFRISDDGTLSLLDITSSNGEAPVTLAFNGEALYVANRQGGGSISGYYVDSDGKFELIENSIVQNRGIFAGSIDFTANNRNLIILEKGTNTQFGILGIDGPNAIVSLPLDEKYRPKVGEEKIIVIPPTEAAFLGEIYGDTYLLSSAGHLSLTTVSPGGNMISYHVKEDGELVEKSFTRKLPGSATCWVEFAKNGTIAYGGNTFRGTMTSYKVEENGEIEIIEETAGEVPFGGTVVPMDFPSFDIGGNLEMQVSGDYLYVNTSIKPRLDVFRINDNGSLTALPEIQVTDDDLFKVGLFYGIAGF